MSDVLTGPFSPFTTDVHQAQESLLIIKEMTDFLLKNPDHVIAKDHDALLAAHIKAHKIAAIIALGKIFDSRSGVHSLNHLMGWLHKNRASFSKERFRARKPPEYRIRYRGISDKKFKNLQEIKRKLQGIYDTKVKALRDESFAHRSLTPKAGSVLVKVMSELADGVAGIYEDIWQAYHNGRQFSLKPRSYSYDRDILKGIETFFSRYTD